MQHLLISNAFVTNPEKSKEYINRFEDYEPTSLAVLALTEFQLYEHAFLLYKKAGGDNNLQAIEILLSQLNDYDRANEFCKKVKHPKV